MLCLFICHRTGSIFVLTAAWCSAITGEEMTMLLKKFGAFYKAHCESKTYQLTKSKYFGFPLN